VYGLIGEVCYQWLEIEQGQRATHRALQLSTLGGYNTGTLLCRVILSRLAQIDGDLEAAGRSIEEAVALLPVEAADYVKQELAAQQARVHLAGGRPALARLALAPFGFSFDDGFSFPALTPEHGISYSLGLLYNSSFHLLLHAAGTAGDPAVLLAGIALAGDVVDRAIASECTLVAIEAHLLRARMHAALAGDERAVGAAHADYVRALELAAPERVLALFVDQGPEVAGALSDLARQGRLDTVDPHHVERLLAVFAALEAPAAHARAQPPTGLPAEPMPQPLVEPLTDRELDVLRLMAQGLKYKEIATTLFVSLNTVRFHVKAIYGKLGTNNRTQAIERARHLRIL